MGQYSRKTSDNRDAIKRRMHAALEQAVAKAALDCETAAKLAAPVDTGHLRNSIRARQVGPYRWVIAVHADYGHFVEFGTSKAAAQPFLLPAHRIAVANLKTAIRSIRRLARGVR